MADPGAADPHWRLSPRLLQLLRCCGWRAGSRLGGHLSHLSSVQNLSWLMIIGDYTIQYIGDYDDPIEGSL